MQVENHKEEVPFAYYQEKFQSLDPADAERRIGPCYENGVFTVELLGRAYTVSHPDAVISPAAPLPMQTFLLRYLLEGREASWAGQWKTFREMPWGELYIQPYTGRVLTRAAFTFGTRLAAFRTAAEKMGGSPVSHGDAGFRFRLVGNYQMQLLIWEGDEEFPPSAQVLYSDNFAEGFAAEDRVVAGDLLISALKANM